MDIFYIFLCFLLKIKENFFSRNKNDSNLVHILGELWEEGYTDRQPTDWYVDPDIKHTGLKLKSSFFPTKSKGPYIETLTPIEQKALKEV